MHQVRAPIEQRPGRMRIEPGTDLLLNQFQRADADRIEPGQEMHGAALSLPYHGRGRMPPVPADAE